MASSADIFNQVRSAVDIVEVIGEHVALKRAGREFKGLCPFHEDHRPSMAVVPHKQIFHCFVCGTGGDVFKFVKEFHKMGNGEALRMLAQRAGIKLPDLPSSRGGGAKSEKDKDGLSPRERIANTNEWACSFFEKHLRSPSGNAGLEYFHGRGLTDETIAKFRLGWSMGWTDLVNAALRLAVSTEHLKEAGLVKDRSDSSPYCAFRERVMFPIVDATGGKPGGGRVIAFGGRILVEKRDEAGNVVEAKYINSPDSRLFNKSESLYGLNLARQQIIRTRVAVVVEGYMDVIACHQAGVTNVIATLGTALTPDHARILKNYAQTVVLVFDSDDAGRRAADRAMEVFVRGSLDIKIAAVPDGKDPCDFCMKNGGEPFQKLVDSAVDALTYKWNALLQQFHGTDSITARQEAITQYLRYLAPMFESAGIAMDPIRRGLLLSKISNLVNMPPTDLQATLKKSAQQSQTAYRPASSPAPSPAEFDSGSGQETSSRPEQDADVKTSATRPNLRTLTGLDAAEAWLLGALLANPALYEAFRHELTLSLFQQFQSLANELFEYFENHGDPDECSLAGLTSTLEDSEVIRQAIELEARVSDWLDPASLSPAHIKLFHQLADDRGLTLQKLIRDSLHELQSQRGTTDPNVEADLGVKTIAGAQIEPDADAAFFKEMDQIKTRNAAGGNRRVVG